MPARSDAQMSAVPANVPLMVTTRGRAIECVHPRSIAVCDLRGDLVFGLATSRR